MIPYRNGCLMRQLVLRLGIGWASGAARLVVFLVLECPADAVCLLADALNGRGAEADKFRDRGLCHAGVVRFDDPVVSVVSPLGIRPLGRGRVSA